MQLQELAVADGIVEFVRTSSTVAEIIFSDWQEVRWRLSFHNVMAVENLNIEGVDLDRVEVCQKDTYIEQIRSLFDEPDAIMNLYRFFTAWGDTPKLRVIAGECHIEKCK